MSGFGTPQKSEQERFAQEVREGVEQTQSELDRKEAQALRGKFGPIYESIVQFANSFHARNPRESAFWHLMKAAAESASACATGSSKDSNRYIREELQIALKDLEKAD